MSTLRIHLFGGLRIEGADGGHELGPQRVAGLLAYLLLHRERPQPRAHLAYVLWPESEDAQARTNLRKTLHQLRRSLPEAERWFTMDGPVLRWRPDAEVDIDVARFDRSVRRAEQAHASGALDEEREHLEEAARVYRGDLLPEMYDDWVEAERERLHQRCADVLGRIVDLLWHQHDDRAALTHAQRLVRHDPLAESSYRRLMRSYARSGERAKALHVYHSCASALHEQLRVGPSDDTVALYEEVLQLAPAGPATASTASRASRGADRRGVVAGAPLVGRGSELHALRAAWDATRGGSTGFVLVTGDPGIGKSRLVEAFTRSLPRREAAAIATRCNESERSLAFAPVVSLLRNAVVSDARHDVDPMWRREASRLLPELADGAPHAPDPLTEGWQRRRLFEALSHVVLARQPLVVVVDDVPWCDGDSLDWLHYLMGFDADARRMLIATGRTHELAGNVRLGALLTDLERDGLSTRIDLAPLSDAETRTLARSLHHDQPDPAALAALVDETEGNPLFVVEMVREGGLATLSPGTGRAEASPPTLPRRLRAVIASRLARLSAPSVELLGMAAVVGREFDVDLLVRVSRRDEDVVVQSLDELWRGRIVRERGAGQYDFSHDKLREVAYGRLSLTQRRLLHRTTAEALEALDVGGRDDVSGRVAFHYERAGDHERAIAHYQRAAHAARSLYAHEEAVRAYDRGLELIDALAPGGTREDWRRVVTAELHEGIGDVFGAKALHEDARGRFERALEHQHDDAIATARLWRKVGLTFTAQYRYDDARQAFDSAEAALHSAESGADTTWWRAWIDVNLSRSNTYYWQLAWRECERVLASMEGAVMQHGSALQRCFYFRDMADKDLAQRRFVVSAERMAYARAALAAAEESGSMLAIATARFSLGFAGIWYDGFEEGAELLEAALATSEATGDAVLRARCLTYLGFLHRTRGDERATERYSHQSLVAAHELTMPEYVGAAHGHLAWLAWRRQDHDACIREGSAALESWTTGQPYPLQWCARLPLLASSMAQDRVSDALEHAAAVLETAQQRLSDDLTAALRCAVRAGPEPGAAAPALARSVALAEAARLL